MTKNKPSLKICLTLIITALLVCLLTSCGMGESEVKVPDVEEVITALQSKAGEYKNAFADLKPIGSFKTENYSYHRMQQTYMGTPVFGRGVVYVSDKNGEEYLVTHNLEDIPENILTEFGLDEERTKAKIEAYLKENYPEGQWENLYDFALEPMYICIYNLVKNFFF